MKDTTKSKGLMSLIPVFIFVIYSILMFWIFDQSKPNFILGYVFSVIATLLAVGIPFVFIKEGKTAKMVFNRFTVGMFTTMYFGAQLVLGLLITILVFLPMPLAVVLELVLIFAYAIIMIVTCSALGYSRSLEKKQKEKVYFIKSITVDLETLKNKVTDENQLKALSSLAETARFSDPMSSEQLMGLETKILENVEKLKDAVRDGNMETFEMDCKNIEDMFKERNEKCKILK